MIYAGVLPEVLVAAGSMSTSSCEAVIRNAQELLVALAVARLNATCVTPIRNFDAAMFANSSC